jgi:hypothetical protein
MWKRQIWTDARAVELMRIAALSENEKVLNGGTRFFLGSDKEVRNNIADQTAHVKADPVRSVKTQPTRATMRKT